MKFRLLADENTSHHLVGACRQREAAFPIVHISDWKEGMYLSVKDPALLMALRESGSILVGFDRASMPMHARASTREGLGHAGVILFRRSVSAVAHGKQARLLVNFWQEAEAWDWADRIEYLPRTKWSRTGGGVRTTGRRPAGPRRRRADLRRLSSLAPETGCWRRFSLRVG